MSKLSSSGGTTTSSILLCSAMIWLKRVEMSKTLHSLFRHLIVSISRLMPSHTILQNLSVYSWQGPARPSRSGTCSCRPVHCASRNKVAMAAEFVSTVVLFLAGFISPLTSFVFMSIAQKSKLTFITPFMFATWSIICVPHDDAPTGCSNMKRRPAVCCLTHSSRQNFTCSRALSSLVFTSSALMLG